MYLRIVSRLVWVSPSSSMSCFNWKPNQALHIPRSVCRRSWGKLRQEIGYATNGPFFFFWCRENWLSSSKEQSQQRLVVNIERCLIVYINRIQTVEHLSCLVTESNVRAAVMAVTNSNIWLLLDKLHGAVVLEMRTGLSHGNLWLVELKQYLLTHLSTATWGSVSIYCSEWVWTQEIRNASVFESVTYFWSWSVVFLTINTFCLYPHSL